MSGLLEEGTEDFDLTLAFFFRYSHNIQFPWRDYSVSETTGNFCEWHCHSFPLSFWEPHATSNCMSACVVVNILKCNPENAAVLNVQEKVGWQNGTQVITEWKLKIGFKMYFYKLKFDPVVFRSTMFLFFFLLSILLLFVDCNFPPTCGRTNYANCL